ncbi:hypothetical protein [Rhizobium terrae]|uniref:hypothetical protein n=1 Tax=Rhizobium terrae TaxID=2171756 RepID=UPI000E3C4455|nr:hypothetical protein [Rhizobium terrae]
MTSPTLTVPTFSDMPPITTGKPDSGNPLKGLLITVFTLKVVVAAFLLATVSLAPPYIADQRHAIVASAD